MSPTHYLTGLNLNGLNLFELNPAGLNRRGQWPRPGLESQGRTG